MFASFMRLWGEVEDAGCWGACMAFQHIEVLRTSCHLRGRRPALHVSSHIGWLPHQHPYGMLPSHIGMRLWLGNSPLLSLDLEGGAGAVGCDLGCVLALGRGDACAVLAWGGYIYVITDDVSTLAETGVERVGL